MASWQMRCVVKTKGHNRKQNENKTKKAKRCLLFYYYCFFSPTIKRECSTETWHGGRDGEKRKTMAEMRRQRVRGREDKNQQQLLQLLCFNLIAYIRSFFRDSCINLSDSKLTLLWGWKHRETGQTVSGCEENLRMEKDAAGKRERTL